MAQSVTAVWQNVYAVCQSLFPVPTLVSFGDPGAYQPDVIVAVMGGRIPVGRPTAAPTRPRDKTCEVNVIISVYVPGSDGASQTSAWTIAQTMSDQLEGYFRTSPNETLSGACREAWVSETAPSFTNVRDPESGNQTGSVAEINVIITAAVRI
jgi:hypothetical protein